MEDIKGVEYFCFQLYMYDIMMEWHTQTQSQLTFCSATYDPIKMPQNMT